MKYNYYFCQKYSDELKNALTNEGVKYEVSEFGTIGLSLISFSLKENDQFLEYITNLTNSKPIVTAVYSQKELQEAEYLCIRPMKQQINIVNCELAYVNACIEETPLRRRVHHIKQFAPFVIAKEPSMNGKTAFWAESTGFLELFADYRVRELTTFHSLKGIEYSPVYVQGKLASEKLFQLTSPNIISYDAISMGHGENVTHCHICGRPCVDIGTEYQLFLRADGVVLDEDFYVTAPVFGPGISRSLYVISQKFYRMLKEKKLAGGITVSPVMFE